ncbi:MAG: Unknown protein [uncultured Campylobacterales bacterium]|uniref:ATP synthase subunit delta n=1 Tax=uncultured Campylobacterales bacterium TaxID=352960 RepID=A0A6S6SF37_9BACT|nr:MAG: Unknown protein [uncultured Campylobacterales bacterium]
MSQNKLVANYSNAFLNLIEKNEYKSLEENLIVLDLVLQNSDVKSVINGLDDSRKKLEFINSFINDDKKLSNFVSLLNCENRLNILCDIVTYIIKFINNENRNFEVKYASKLPIQNNDVKELNELFSKKLDANLAQVIEENDLNGLKVSIDDLNIAVKISMSDLKQRLKKHIFKNF